VHKEQVIWEERFAIPHVGQCTLSLCVLAVACTMHNEALRKRYRALQNVTERCRTLRDVTKRYGSVTELLRNVTEPLRKKSILPIT